MKHNDDMEKKIAQSIEKIDCAEVKTPELLAFTNLVSQEKQKNTKRQNRQFAIFIFLSVFIVAGVIGCFVASVYLFLALQAAYFIVFLGVLLHTRKAGAPL